MSEQFSLDFEPRRARKAKKATPGLVVAHCGACGVGLWNKSSLCRMCAASDEQWQAICDEDDKQ